MAYSDLILAETNLAAYWRLNETGSLPADAVDSFGSLDGPYQTGVTLGSAGRGSDPAATFDGSTGFAVMPSSPVTSVTSAGMEAWFRTTDYTQIRQCVFFNGTDNAPNGYGVTVNKENTSDGGLYVLISGIAWVYSGVLVTDALWHYVALSWVGTTLKIWLDNVLVYDNVPGFTPNTPTKFLIGTERDIDHPYVFKGQIADVAAYSSPLSGAQVNSHFTGVGGGPGVAGPVLFSSHYQNQGWRQ